MSNTKSADADKLKADETKPDENTPEEVKPSKPAGYRLNWDLKGAGKLEVGKVYARKSFKLSDEQIAVLLANGTISEA